MTLSVRFVEIEDMDALAARWRALENMAPPHSFFLRWTWIGSWLKTLKAEGIPLPSLMVICDDDHDAGLALIGHGAVLRKLGPTSALWLNESGHREGDRPFIEYNGLLTRAGSEAACTHSFCEAIGARTDWRVFHLSGLEFGSPLIDIPGISRAVIRQAYPAHYVDLAKVRAARCDYLSLLSSNTRNQIRRSQRDEPGELQIRAVADPGSADHWLDAMKCLNHERHRDNAWDSIFFRDFTRHIIAAGMEDRSVELLHVTSNGDTIGYLLNFVWDGRAMNYQSAFVAPRGPKSKPGLMCHAAAVVRYARSGLMRYSFLAGKDRYKQSLSTGAEQLNWWILERSDWRLNAEAAVRKILRR